jgi:hypothetical protein
MDNRDLVKIHQEKLTLITMNTEEKLYLTKDKNYLD